MRTSGPRATRRSCRCAGRRGPCSWSRTTWPRSRRPVTGRSGWKRARSCGRATTSPRSSTPTWRPPAASRANATSPRTPSTALRRECGGVRDAGLTARGPQPQAHGRAAGGTRARGDLAVLSPRQPPAAEQADADAAEPAPVTGLALEEPVEDALVIAVGDADALVFHRHLDPAPAHLRCPLHLRPYPDGAAVG